MSLKERNSLQAFGEDLWPTPRWTSNSQGKCSGYVLAFCEHIWAGAVTMLSQVWSLNAFTIWCSVLQPHFPSSSVEWVCCLHVINEGNEYPRFAHTSPRETPLLGAPTHPHGVPLWTWADASQYHGGWRACRLLSAACLSPQASERHRHLTPNLEDCCCHSACTGSLPWTKQNTVNSNQY